MSQQQATNRIPLSALLLGLAGLIPFAAGAVSQLLPLPVLTGEVGIRLIVTYGAIILSFLGGIRWGTALGPYDGRRQGVDFSASVLGSLVGLAAVFAAAVPALALLIAGFLMQALWDLMSVESGRLPPWFGKLRMLLTAGAVISLVAALTGVLLT